MDPEDYALQCLPQGLSHILVEISDKGLKFDPQAYLEDKGVPIASQIVHVDDSGRKWLIMSLTLSDVRKLILEFIEKGLAANIRGINLKS